FIKGLIISILISLALVVVFALCLKWFDITEKVIVPVTFGIKYISVIIGSLIAIKGSSKGLIKGAVFGALYMACAFSIFSILASTFVFDITTLLDFSSSILLGAIVGIIKVNKN
ncbi:MAG: TIGR04086 family membrane protein, partial [Clostridia bacterium]|nr:TIGR04086 family membrane protein [Clostridia bacterium]